jgi:hypothetical protein
LSSIAGSIDNIPADAKSLKQFAPAIALYKTKLVSVKSNIRSAFAETVVVTKNEGVRVTADLPEMFSLWDCAKKVKHQAALIEDLAMALSTNLLPYIVEQKSFEYSMASNAWQCRPGTPVPERADFGSIAETIQSLFSFMAGSVFHNQSEVFQQFGRKVWLPFATRILRKFGPGEEWYNLESAICRLGLLPTDAQHRLIIAWETSYRDQKSAQNNKILGTIRDRLLADLSHKIVETNLPPEMGELASIYPKYVSYEATRMVAEFFEKHQDIIPQMVTLYVVMRQSQFLDPKATAPKAAGIFFNDCTYLTILLSLLVNNSENPEKFKKQTALLKVVSQRSITYFLKTVNTRIADRIMKTGQSSFLQGLATEDQAGVLDRAVETGLMELSACFNEWKSSKIDMNVSMIWISILIDNFLRTVNVVAQATAKAAVSKGAPVNTWIWGIFRKFLNSIEMILLKEVAEVINSYKVATRVRAALTASAADIAELKEDPIANDAQLFGISTEGFENLLKCNPLLQNESKETIQQLCGKFILPRETLDAPTLKAETDGEPNYAALFRRG